MLNIGNKKYRNMQEQVGWNSERIDKILEFLDGVNLSDNVVVINDMSQVLTPEELEVVNRTVSFLIYDGSLYIKKSQDASEAKFDIIFTISGSSVISFNSKEITVTLSNGALGIIAAAYAVYSVTQVDSMFSLKADKTYVDNQLAAKANLEGATFTGNVIMGSGTEFRGFEKITDKDSNKRFVEGAISLPSISGVNFTYARWSLSGTHFMIAIAGEAASGTSFNGYANILTIGGLPSWILSKIYPTFGAFIEVKPVDFYNSDWSKESNPMNVALGKTANTLTITNFGSTYTTTKLRGFRFAFDLLIDDE